MTLKEFLEFREHRFDHIRERFCDLNKFYANGWRDAYTEIKNILEHHGFDLSIPIE